MSVCPSVRPPARVELGSHWTDFLKICLENAGFFKITSALDKDVCTFMIISLWILPKMKNVSVKRCRENQNTRFMFNNFLFPENHAICEIMWKSMVEPDRPDMNIIRRMHIACWITKATNTHLEYNTYWFSTATVVSWTRLNVTLYLHCLFWFSY